PGRAAAQGVTPPVRKPKRLSLEELAPYLWEPPEPPGELRQLADVGILPVQAIDWRAVFGNDHPVEIEVGSGKGAFLVAVAPAHPDVNFFGIEIVRKYQLYCATRMAVRGLRNVRMAGIDA